MRIRRIVGLALREQFHQLLCMPFLKSKMNVYQPDLFAAADDLPEGFRYQGNLRGG